MYVYILHNTWKEFAIGASKLMFSGADPGGTSFGPGENFENLTSTSEKKLV